MKSHLIIITSFISMLLHAYQVTFTADSNGTLHGQSVQSIPAGGKSVAITAIPANHYQFSYWTGDFKGADNPLILKNVFQNMTVKACFSPIHYTIVFHAGENGTIKGESRQHITHMETCRPIKAIPRKGYHFERWLDDSGQTISTEPILSFKKPLGHCNITAKFRESIYFQVSFASDPFGSIKGICSQKVLKEDNCTTVYAIPLAGYMFSNWSGDVMSRENPLSVKKVTRNQLIKANFIPDPNSCAYILKTMPPGAGSTTPQAAVHAIQPGTSMTLQANAAEHYRFKKWTATPLNAALFSDRTSTATTVTIMQHATIMAIFELNNEHAVNIKALTVSIRGQARDSIRMIMSLPNFQPNHDLLKIRIGNSLSTFYPGLWSDRGIYGDKENYSAVYKNGQVHFRISKASVELLEQHQHTTVTVSLNDTVFSKLVKTSENCLWSYNASKKEAVHSLKMTYSNKNKRRYRLSLKLTGNSNINETTTLHIGQSKWQLKSDTHTAIKIKHTKTCTNILIKGASDTLERGQILPRQSQLQIKLSQSSGPLITDTIETIFKRSIHAVPQLKSLLGAGQNPPQQIVPPSSVSASPLRL